MMEGSNDTHLICRDMGMCHYFGYFLGCPGFWGTILGYSRILGYHVSAVPEFLGIMFFDKI